MTSSRALVFVLVLAASAATAAAAEAPRQSWPQVTLGPSDRVLVLAPHPDDESIACGGILRKAVEMNLPVRVAFLTCGDNNQWSFVLYRKRLVIIPRSVRGMGRVRHREALAAGAALGLAPTHLVFLGYPDFGTLAIWNTHWNREKAFRAMLTGARAVPYDFALRPHAPYKGEEILRDITTVLSEFRPTKVFVSHPGDHNPDHRALYLFTQVALWNLEPDLQPEVYPYLVHFAAYPKPRGYDPESWLAPPLLFLPQVAWEEFVVSPADVAVKQAAIRRHASQFRASAKYLESFARRNELFGDFHPVRLTDGMATNSLTSDTEEEEDEQLADIASELTEEERASFTGIRTEGIRLDGDRVTVSLGFSRPLANAVKGGIYLYGYRKDTDFKAMPKIRLRVGKLGWKLYDEGRVIDPRKISVRTWRNGIEASFPLELLGHPERILTSARTYFGGVPLDWTAWRVMEVGTTP